MRNHVLLTGASGALGQSLLRYLAQASYVIWALDRPQRVEGKPRIDHIRWLGADLSHEANTKDIIDRILTEAPTMSRAILAAGGYRYGGLNETSSADIDHMIEINFKTVYHVARPLFAHMCKQGHGHLIVIGARPALAPKDGVSSMGYALSKGMVLNLAAMLNATPNKPPEVRVSVIVPSIIDTAANRSAMPKADPNDWVAPDDIAKTVLRLFSDEAKTWQNTLLKLYHRA